MDLPTSQPTTLPTTPIPPSEVVELWSRTNCVIVDPNPESTNPFDGEDVVTFPGRGKIAKPPPAYHAAVQAVQQVANPVYKWWLGMKVEGMNKCPLIEEGKCYYWALQEKHIEQWHFVKGYKPREVVELEQWMQSDSMEWKSSWSRVRTVGWTDPNGIWRGTLNRDSVVRYRQERRQQGTWDTIIEHLNFWGIESRTNGLATGQPFGIASDTAERARDGIGGII